VIIECTNCHARYQYDEDRFERKPSKKIKCAKRSTIFEIHNPAFADAPKAEPKNADQTFHRRDEAKKTGNCCGGGGALPRTRAKDTGKVSTPQMRKASAVPGGHQLVPTPAAYIALRNRG
jgi:hypothetical protein